MPVNDRKVKKSRSGALFFADPVAEAEAEPPREPEALEALEAAAFSTEAYADAAGVNADAEGASVSKARHWVGSAVTGMVAKGQELE